MTAAVLTGSGRLSWVTWRQHRPSLTAVLGLFCLTAAVMTVTGLDPRWHATVISTAWRYQLYPLMIFDMLLLPVVAGLVLGAPLLAAEAESGTVWFAWTQGVSKVTLLLVKVLGLAGGLAIAAAGLGLEYEWWAGPQLKLDNSRWADWPFMFHPLPYAGWMLFAFCLGVLIGVAVRRTVPALAGTLAGYAAVFYLDNSYWRPYYLPPLRSSTPYFRSFGNVWPTAWFADPSGRIYRFTIAYGLSRRDGQPLVHGDLRRPQGWVAHHVVQWTTYQPASRFVPFQVLEFGYLTLLSVALVTAAVMLIRRRSA
jgi:hypothetical protein